MSRKESEFLKKLLVTFQGEAEERVRSLASGLIELEEATEASKRAEVVELVFREVHSLKGAARAVNLMEIEAICQGMEDVFAILKRHKVAPSLALLDLLHQATDLLKGLLSTSTAEQGSGDKSRHAPLIRQMKEHAKQAVRNAEEATGEQPAAPSPIQPSEPASPPQPPIQAQIQPQLSSAPTPPLPAPALPAPALPAPRDEESPKRIELFAEAVTSALTEEQPDAQVGNFNNDWHLETATQPLPRPGVEEKSGAVETVRIDTTRLESLLLQVEELVSVKLAVSQRAAELRELRLLLNEWDKKWAKLYPAIRALSHVQESLDKTDSGQPYTNQNSKGDELHRAKAEVDAVLEFLEWNQNWGALLNRRLATISSAVSRDQRSTSAMVDHLLQDMKQVLMLPFASILEIFPSVTRDLARQQNKEVHIVFHGAEIEVDRRILQEIKDPLMHLVRNCIDHGIETPDVRERRGKARRGTITITVAQRDSSKFEVLVADDGGGIDRAKIRNTALRLGLISTESAERMNAQETEALIFQSGFSTSPMITDISGRGLGLAIVQEKVEKLGGVIALESEPERGTIFHLLLPLTLATLRGLIVRSEGHTLLLPLIHIERVARIDSQEVQTVQSRETIRLDGQAFSFVRLGKALELPAKSATREQEEKLFVVILSAAEKRIAFCVDEVIGEQEVLMKGLGAQLARVRNVAGATVLGTGEVVPILNVPDLIKSAIKTMDVSIRVADQPSVKDKSILIAEDSITARMQLKNILELNGYSVKTAVDGLEALMTLRTERFDLVVSDVDMPRLSGLELTSRIRNDKKLADMPVVLVTTLASREDQERGIEVGANAYITKSNFDQNKLLDAIRRLV